MFCKKYDKPNVPGRKSNSTGTRFSRNNVLCMLFVAISWVLSFSLVNALKQLTDTQTAYILGFFWGGTPVGMFHMYQVKWIHKAIKSSLEWWYLLLIPPVFMILCFDGFIAFALSIMGGVLIGWLFMVIDPIKFLLGLQCVKSE